MAILAAGAIGLGSFGTAHALQVGETVTGYVEINGRQVPLPEGDWLVAGKGKNRVVSGVFGAYGTIDNAMLLQSDAKTVHGLVEINTNRISVTEGWGTTNACSRDDALARLNVYRTAVDGLCFFVTETAIDDGSGDPDAWKNALADAQTKGLTVPTEWLTVGYRVSNRQDVVDVRYHFDGVELGKLQPDKTDWSITSAQADHIKYQTVTELNAWAGLFSAWFEAGLRGQMLELSDGAPMPHPLVGADLPDFNADAVGRASKRKREQALERLVKQGVIPAEDFEAYKVAVNNVVPPPTIEDYYRSLIAKTISFNLFRVSVDYLLAFIVTVNAAVSGYITAAIVVTHSMAQIANDMAWDSYIAGQTRDGSELVEFNYIGSILGGRS